MARFVQVGSQWLNLDLVQRIEFLQDAAQPGPIVVAKVLFVSGATIDFRTQPEIQALQAFVQAHKAP